MKWFDIGGFVEYMRTEFPMPMKNHFTYDLLYNIKQENCPEFLLYIILLMF